VQHATFKQEPRYTITITLDNELGVAERLELISS